MVLHSQNLNKTYSKRKVVDNVSITVNQGDIVGLLGPNGAGKTTTFYMTVGMIRPNAGKIFLDDIDISKKAMYQRARLGIGYLPQENSVFRDLSVEDNIKAILEFTPLSKKEQKIKLESLLDEFGLTKVRKNLGKVLSGGERNRLHLAMTLKDGGNVLLLDEPTNDIDINTLRALEEAIDHFAGAVLVISHDRWFMDRLATHILSFEDDGQVVFFEGNFSDYEEKKKARLGDLTPKRPKFKNVINR